MIEKVLIAVFTQLGSILISRILERYSKTPQAQASEEAVLVKAKAFDDAFKEAMTGPMTPEQRTKLKDAIKGFIRNTDSNSPGGV